MKVLDSSALLAFLFREEGAELVAKTIDQSCMSAVNLCEVIGRFTREGHDHEKVSRRIATSSIEIVPFGVADASLAASLVPTTRHLGLSLGDRACLALAMSRKLPALTADRVWADIEIDVQVVVVR